MNNQTITPFLFYKQIIAAWLIFVLYISTPMLAFAEDQKNAYPLENISLPLYVLQIKEGKIQNDIMMEFCISRDACVDDWVEVKIEMNANDSSKSPMAKLFVNKKQIEEIKLDLSSAFSGEINFYQIDLDETNEHQEILISSYSGGAHCCTDYNVIALYDSKLSFINFITVDGYHFLGLYKDGSLRFLDNNFLYAFGSYADSVSIDRFYKLEHGKRIDLSKQPQFKEYYLEEMKSLEAECKKVDHLPTCAAYAAAAARVGKFYEAWNYIKTHLNQDPIGHRTYPYFCKLKTTSNSPCPEDQEVKFNNFPDALLYALKEWGYIEK